MYPRGWNVAGIEGVLYSRVAWRWLSIGGSSSEVDICKIKFYICRVIRNPQLDLNQFELLVLRGYGDLIHYRSNAGLVNY